MNNIVENVIATIVVIALSTAVELILQFFGLDAQKSITIAGIVLFTLAILFMIFRKYYPAYIRWLTKRLLKNALQLNTNEADTSKITFKKEIIAQVHLENSEAELTRSSLVTVFSSQEECEPYMREAFRTAKTIKILTIRGEKYFLGSRSLFYKLYLLKQKQAKNFTIQVLVLLPEAEHITEKLAEELGQYSAEEIRDKMHNVLKILRHGSNELDTFLLIRGKHCQARLPLLNLA